MLLDRGVEVDHTTIFRWIQAYAVELEKRIRPHLGSVAKIELGSRVILERLR
jgi:transposase-like protein